jgi:hypothetical protein
MSCGAIIN